jgi:hypothetical protein
MQTWIKAIINRHFSTWLMFTAQEVQTHLPKSVATTMGHLDQQQKIYARQNRNQRTTAKNHPPSRRKRRTSEGADTSEGGNDKPSANCRAYCKTNQERGRLSRANKLLHQCFCITGQLMEYRQLISDPTTRGAWQLSAANEFGRLAQGVGGRVKGTDTIHFIPHHEMPTDRQATYPRFVCSERLQKQEKNRTRMTVGGNLITYPGDKSTRMVELKTTKILFNSVVSTPQARFCTMDITNFYLNTPLNHPECLCIPVTLIPEEIMCEYKLQHLIKNGNVMARIDKGMYGLPQAGILANKLLKEGLQPHRYHTGLMVTQIASVNVVTRC